MSNLYCAANYKNQIINLLLENKNLVKLIDPAPSECEYLDITDVLLGGEWIFGDKQYKEQGHIFDYDFVEESTSDAKTFLFVETDIGDVRQKMFMDFNLYIYIFTAKGHVRLTDRTSPTVQQVKDMGYFADKYANRIDVLCDIVDRTINGNERIQGIGALAPADKEFYTLYCPNSSYYGKRLKYSITNLNEMGDAYGDH